jgi:hypothetical protein
MARSAEDIVEIFGSYLLGIVTSGFAVIFIAFRDNLCYPLGKAAIALLSLLFIRLFTSIRLGTSSEILCGVWVQIRGTFTLGGIGGFNFWYYLHLYNKLSFFILEYVA